MAYKSIDRRNCRRFFFSSFNQKGFDEVKTYKNYREIKESTFRSHLDFIIKRKSSYERGYLSRLELKINIQ